MAHQALESIDPKGDDILIQGIHTSQPYIQITEYCPLSFSGCGPVGLLAVGLAKAMGATKM